jgi:Uri superfamily endonuclease
MMEFWTSPDAIPRRPGAYVLAIELPRPIALALPKKASVPIAPGCYLYCGSANGPGGMRARIARHMRRGKLIRWHIDNLTETSRVLGAWTVAGGHECQLVASLAHLPIPKYGFGSSDCRSCSSHLLRWPGHSSTLLRRGIDSIRTKPAPSANTGPADHRARVARSKPTLSG